MESHVKDKFQQFLNGQEFATITRSMPLLVDY